MEGRQERPRHPMGVVVRRTGLTAHVLRAWERRYGAVSPDRTEGGQRLYSDADVLRLRLLKRATESGRPIGTVASLSTESLAGLVGEDMAVGAGGAAGAGGPAESESEPAVGGGGASGGARRWRGGWNAEAVDRHLAVCLGAADRMDGSELRAELFRAVVKLSAPGFVAGVAVPLLHRVGELWAAGALRPAQEHVVSTAVRQVLDWLLSRYQARPGAPLVVVGTPAGELHEFGAMLAGVVAADAGWRVVYLGPSLPASEIAGAAERAGASMVALSVVAGMEGAVDGERAAREVAELRRLLPEGVLLVTGGRRATAVAAEEVMRVTDLDAFREVLAVAAPAMIGGGA